LRGVTQGQRGKGDRHEIAWESRGEGVVGKCGKREKLSYLCFGGREKKERKGMKGGGG